MVNWLERQRNRAGDGARCGLGDNTVRASVRLMADEMFKTQQYDMCSGRNREFWAEHDILMTGYTGRQQSKLYYAATRLMAAGWDYTFEFSNSNPDQVVTKFINVYDRPPVRRRQASLADRRAARRADVISRGGRVVALPERQVRSNVEDAALEDID